MLKRYLYLFLLIASVGSFSALDCADESSVCNTAESCSMNDNSLCKCYCAYKGAPRDWEPGDKGKELYISNDPWGHGCYCQKRDLQKTVLDELGLGEHAKNLWPEEESMDGSK